RAVMASIEEVGVAQVVCLGDVATLGSRPGAILDMLREIGCPCILGNHDEFLLEPALIRAYTDVPIVVDAVDWCRDQLSGDDFARQPGQPRAPVQGVRGRGGADAARSRRVCDGGGAPRRGPGRLAPGARR